MWHMNQHWAGSWQVRGAHHHSGWHGRELNKWQRVKISEQNRYLSRKLPAGWESQRSLIFTSVLLCNAWLKHPKGATDHLPWPGRVAAELLPRWSGTWARGLLPSPGSPSPSWPWTLTTAFSQGLCPSWLWWCMGSRSLSSHQCPWSVVRRHQVST